MHFHGNPLETTFYRRRYFTRPNISTGTTIEWKFRCNIPTKSAGTEPEEIKISFLNTNSISTSCTFPSGSNYLHQTQQYSGLSKY
jgi:hypothetical protein